MRYEVNSETMNVPVRIGQFNKIIDQQKVLLKCQFVIETFIALQISQYMKNATWKVFCKEI